jgi:hypothetical protein
MIVSPGHGKTVTEYGSQSLVEYSSKWDLPMGLGEMAVNDNRSVENGVFRITAVPFQTSADSVLDHTKYFAVSRESFPMPKNGSLQFSVDIKASTPGTQPGKVVHGYYTDTRDGSRLYAQPTLEGQQAAVIFNMSNVETDQLFDWFVSGSSVFALIERLPSTVTHTDMTASDSRYVGLSKIYTQVVKSAPLTPGETHTFALRYTRDATQSAIDWVLDGAVFAHVDYVGIPLDTQGVPYTGIYPSYHAAPGEELRDRMDTFVIKHGLFNMMSPFPFQHPDAPELAVSIPPLERLFGQGAHGEFSNLHVTTVTN